MDIAHVNSVLEQAIVRFQSDEVEALWEKYKVPTPMQMHRKHGMAMGVTDREVLKPLEQALSPLTHGPGKLTDPNRTPDRAAVKAALDQIVDEAPNMLPKYRSNVLKNLRSWLKVARQHAKRMQQAAYSYRVGDVGQGDIMPARIIRQLIDNARAEIAPMRGGGPGGKASTKSKPKKKKKAPQSPYKVPSLAQQVIGMDPAERKKMAKSAMRKWGGKYVVGDATVQTFLRILEAALWKAARDDTSGINAYEFEDELKEIKSKFASKGASDDKGALLDLSRAVLKKFSVYLDYGIDQVIKDWLLSQIKVYLKNGKLPYAPGGTQVRPFVDKRQIGMKFEAIQRLKLALVG